MQRKDKTGLMGQGPLTGRGFGPCAGDVPLRRGFGHGCGRGYGFRAIDLLELTKEEKQKILKAELAELEAEKKAIEKALKESK